MSSDKKELRRTGWIKKDYFADRGFGIIVPDDGGPDVFLHHSTMRASGIDDLEYRERVAFDLVENGRDGRLRAVNVARLGLSRVEEIADRIAGRYGE
jgi:CspA family cold shock protein